MLRICWDFCVLVWLWRLCESLMQEIRAPLSAWLETRWCFQLTVNFQMWCNTWIRLALKRNIALVSLRRATSDAKSSVDFTCDSALWAGSVNVWPLCAWHPDKHSIWPVCTHKENKGRVRGQEESDEQKEEGKKWDETNQKEVNLPVLCSCDKRILCLPCCFFSSSVSFLLSTGSYFKPLPLHPPFFLVPVLFHHLY